MVVFLILILEIRRNANFLQKLANMASILDFYVVTWRHLDFFFFFKVCPILLTNMFSFVYITLFIKQLKPILWMV